MHTWPVDPAISSQWTKFVQKKRANFTGPTKEFSNSLDPLSTVSCAANILRTSVLINTMRVCLLLDMEREGNCYLLLFLQFGKTPEKIFQ